MNKTVPMYSAGSRVHSEGAGISNSEQPSIEDLLTNPATLDVFRHYFPNFKNLKRLFQTGNSKNVNIFLPEGGNHYLVKDFSSKEFPDDKARNILQVIEHYEGCELQEAITRLKADLGYIQSPNDQKARYQVQKNPVYQPIKPEPEASIIPVDNDQWEAVLRSQNSNFHSYARSLGVSSDHLKEWLVGSDQRGNTTFGLQNLSGQKVNIKHIPISPPESERFGKRIKEKHPFYLKNPSETTKYGQCLYGEHRFREGYPKVFVESEKTAVLGSFFYPQFDFVATGGATALSSKIAALKGEKGFVLIDADETGRKLNTLKRLHEKGLDFIAVDLFPERTDGYDLADAIGDGQRPNLTSYRYQIKIGTGTDFKIYGKEFISEEAAAFIEFLRKEKKVVMSAKTGSGKTTLALEYIAKYWEGRIFIIEPLQIIGRGIAAAYSGSGKIAYIEGGSDEYDIRAALSSKIIVCTFDSYSKIGSYLEENDLLICDEVHALTQNYNMPDKRPKYDYVFDQLKKAKNVLCISATPQKFFRQYGFKYAEFVASKMNKVIIRPVIYTGKIHHELTEKKQAFDFTSKQLLIRLNDTTLIDEVKKTYEAELSGGIGILSADTKKDPNGIYQSIVKTKRIPDVARLVLTTSLIDCGIDIYNENISAIIAEHNHESLSITDTLQFIARARKVPEMAVTIYKQKRNRKPIDANERYKTIFSFAAKECEYLNEVEPAYRAANPAYKGKGRAFADTDTYCRYNPNTQKYEVRELLILHQVEQELNRSLTAEAFFEELAKHEHIKIQEHAPESLKIKADPESSDKGNTDYKKAVQKKALDLLKNESPIDIFTALYHNSTDAGIKKAIIHAGYNIHMNESAEQMVVQLKTCQIGEKTINFITDRTALLVFKNFLYLKQRGIKEAAIVPIMVENESPRKWGDLLTELDTLYKIEHAEILGAAVKRDVQRLLTVKKTIEKNLTELASINKEKANPVSPPEIRTKKVQIPETSANEATADYLTRLINRDRPKGLEYSKNKAMQLLSILFYTPEKPNKTEISGKTVKYFSIETREKTFQSYLDELEREALGETIEMVLA